VKIGEEVRNVIVRPLSTVGYTSVVASVIHRRQWSVV